MKYFTRLIEPSSIEPRDISVFLSGPCVCYWFCFKV